MYKKLISVRITIEEFKALSSLAKLEVRSISSWLRSKIVVEAQKAGLLNLSEGCKKDDSSETSEMISKENKMNDSN